MSDELGRFQDAGSGAGGQTNDETDAKKSNLKSKNPNDPSCGILPVAVDSDTYNMNHKHRGKCLIFNQKKFEAHTNQSVRLGTDIDANDLRNHFRDLDFEATVYHNASKTEILGALTKASGEDHSDYDCFACVILTHGHEGVIYGRDGMFNTNLIFKLFRGGACPSLAGKPKLFFIQACQGKELDGGVQLKTSHDGGELVKIPSEADFLVAHSTVPGFYAWRNEIKGSWFIQALCCVLRNHAKEKDLVEMLTIVNRVVAYDYESYNVKNPSKCGKKQVPSFTSRLTRKVYFPSKDSLPNNN